MPGIGGLPTSAAGDAVEKKKEEERTVNKRTIQKRAIVEEVLASQRAARYFPFCVHEDAIAWRRVRGEGWRICDFLTP